MTMLRSRPVYGFSAASDGTSQPSGVNRAAGILHGASAIQMGEASGHDLLIDETTLSQVNDAINATGARGMLCRFTHPGTCRDGLGRQLGRARNARVVGDRVLFDCHLSEVARRSPEGDLYAYTLDMADDSPDACGFSISFENRPAWKRKDGSEIEAKTVFTEDGYRSNRPDDATTKVPLARVVKLRAVDLVAEPAANAAGLFSTPSLGSLSVEAFTTIDQFLATQGVPIEQAKAFSERYFAARISTPAASAALNKETSTMSLTTDQLKTLSAAHPKHLALIVEHFTGGKSEEKDVLAAITQAEMSDLRTANAQLVKDLAEARTTPPAAAAAAAKDPSMADLMKRIDELAAQNKALVGLKDGAPPAVGGAAGDVAPPSGGDTLAAAQEKWKAEFAAKPQTRSEFFGELDTYLAFRETGWRQEQLGRGARLSSRVEMMNPHRVARQIQSDGKDGE